MAQLKSMMFAILFFVGFIVPAFLLFFLNSIHQNAFLKATSEITELVKEDAGVSDRVKSAVRDYEKLGYTITFHDQHQQPVTGIVHYGDTVHVHYKYKFSSVWDDQTLETSNKVFILKRNGENVPGWEKGDHLLKRYVVNTIETKNANQEQTFTLPGLNRLNNVTSDTGSVQVVKVEGNKVTVRVSNGAPTRIVQTGGSLMADDTKIVTDTIVTSDPSGFPNTKEYNKGGYKGTLTRSGTLQTKQTGGEYFPAETKEVGNQETPDYKDEEGFSGTLERYVHSVTQIPEQSKTVTNQTSSAYSDAEGYEGTLTQYVASGSYTPADTKQVTGQTSPNYNSDGYSGTLTQYVYSGSYTPEDSKWITAWTSSYYNADGYSGTLSRYEYQARDTKKVSQNRFLSVRPDFKWNGYWWELYQVDYSDPELKYSSFTHYNVGGYSGLLFLTDDSFRKAYHSPPSYSGLYKGQTAIGTTRFYTVTFEGNVTREAVYRYQGFVTKPAVDNRVYRYQGTVTKPAVDTRVYRYQGVVTKPASEIKNYRYGGKVTKPAIDTRTYEYTQNYKGTATKKGEDTRTFDNYYKYRLTFEYE